MYMIQTIALTIMITSNAFIKKNTPNDVPMTCEKMIQIKYEIDIYKELRIEK